MTTRATDEQLRAIRAGAKAGGILSQVVDELLERRAADPQRADFKSCFYCGKPVGHKPSCATIRK